MNQEKMSPLDRVLREVEEALTTFYEGIGRHHKGVSGRIAGEFTPPADVRDAKSSVVISLELPGLSKDDIEIEASDGWLTVSGEKQEVNEQAEEGYLVRECSYGAFSRRFVIPHGADVGSISATMNNGKLDIRVPLKDAQSSEPQRIDVREK